MNKISNKDLNLIAFRIESKINLTILFLNIMIVVRNINKWQSMIKKNKNNNNCGVKFLLLKI